MKIIDFKKKGTVVRFFLGADDLKEWWGDDWDDAPYDCNAGKHSFAFFKECEYWDVPETYYTAQEKVGVKDG